MSDRTCLFAYFIESALPNLSDSHIKWKLTYKIRKE